VDLRRWAEQWGLAAKRKIGCKFSLTPVRIFSKTQAGLSLMLTLLLRV
jgi:hypothetical protein